MVLKWGKNASIEKKINKSIAYHIEQRQSIFSYKNY